MDPQTPRSASTPVEVEQRRALAVICELRGSVTTASSHNPRPVVAMDCQSLHVIAHRGTPVAPRAALLPVLTEGLTVFFGGHNGKETDR